jgi:hypothetical protein
LTEIWNLQNDKLTTEVPIIMRGISVSEFESLLVPLSSGKLWFNFGVSLPRWERINHSDDSWLSGFGSILRWLFTLVWELLLWVEIFCIWGGEVCRIRLEVYPSEPCHALHELQSAQLEPVFSHAFGLFFSCPMLPF